MEPCHLSEADVHLFETLCYAIIEGLGDPKPPRGPSVLKRFSQALGWADYDALLSDATNYGGKLDWKVLYHHLLTNGPRIFGVPAAQYNGALFSASRMMCREHEGMVPLMAQGTLITPRAYFDCAEQAQPEGLLLMDGLSAGRLQSTARTDSKNRGTSYADELLQVVSDTEGHSELTYQALFWPCGKTEVLRIYANQVLLTLEVFHHELILIGQCQPDKPSRQKSFISDEVVYGDVTALGLASGTDTNHNRHRLNPGWWLCKYGPDEPRIDLSSMTSEQVQWVEWFFRIGAGFDDLAQAPAFEFISAWCTRHPRIAAKANSPYFPHWGSKALQERAMHAARH